MADELERIPEDLRKQAIELLFTSLYPDVKDEWTRQTLKEYLLKNTQGMIPLFYRAIEVVADLQAKLEDLMHAIGQKDKQLLEYHDEVNDRGADVEYYKKEAMQNAAELQRLRTENAELGKPVTDETKYWAIVGFYTADIIGVCSNREDVLSEEPQATFIPISKEDFDSFEEWTPAKRFLVLASRSQQAPASPATEEKP